VAPCGSLVVICVICVIGGDPLLDRVLRRRDVDFLEL
jgi:hypothetical protein